MFNTHNLNFIMTEVNAFIKKKWKISIVNLKFILLISIFQLEPCFYLDSMSVATRHFTWQVYDVFGGRMYHIRCYSIHAQKHISIWIWVNCTVYIVCNRAMIHYKLSFVGKSANLVQFLQLVNDGKPVIWNV